ncbi:hypothetical protein EDC04DRAFT_2612090, partial [Pisolithus marmoratus]
DQWASLVLVWDQISGVTGVGVGTAGITGISVGWASIGVGLAGATGVSVATTSIGAAITSVEPADNTIRHFRYWCASLDGGVSRDSSAKDSSCVSVEFPNNTLRKAMVSWVSLRFLVNAL